MLLHHELTNSDKQYINYLRGGLILRVVLMHLGLAWFYMPYSSYFGLFFPALFGVSGIVSYYSYRRAGDVVHYVIKRIARIVVTFYIISGSAYLILFIINPQWMGLSEFLNWLLINPKSVDQPYPMGQIWFLRALILLTVIVLPFFYLSLRNINYLLVPVFISLLISLAQQFHAVGSVFMIVIGDLNEINTYHPLVNMGYFCFCAWASYVGLLKRTSWMFCLVFVGALMAWAIFQHQHFSLNLADHSYFQDFFYLSLGYAGIGLLFGLRAPITLVLEKIPAFGRMLLFFSTHAFSIFMIHSLYIYLAEVVFNLKDMKSINEILIKIIFVILASVLSAVPLSYVCKKITGILIAKIDDRKKQQVAI